MIVNVVLLFIYGIIFIIADIGLCVMMILWWREGGSITSYKIILTIATPSFCIITYYYILGLRKVLSDYLGLWEH